MPGPVPKRSDQRRRRNKVDIDHAVMTAPVDRPSADNNWHPIARGWYDSLAESGQSRWYEPSDWQRARYVAEAMTRNLEATRFSAQMFAAVSSAMTELLDTEGARRRVRMEIERHDAAPAVDDAKVSALNAYRDAAGA